MKWHIISKFGLIGAVIYIIICAGFFIFATKFCAILYDGWGGLACAYSILIPAMPWILWWDKLLYSFLINLVIFYIIGTSIERLIIKKRKSDFQKPTF
ncbi:MAG: hypothetical protein U9O55_04080 [Patescibacteria group bacterium]|nr:hypothetical protein [Patescibacteria group bacterium]